jgi:DNA-binding IclR family transcriptional regulator
VGQTDAPKPAKGVEPADAKASRAGLQMADRIVSVLKAFADSGSELGVSELARMLSLPKSVVHRTLTSLVATGFLQKDDASARYRLGPEAVGLGLAALGSVDLVSIALPHMEILRSRTQETVTLSVRVGSARAYISQLESPQDVRMTVEIGRRWPLYAGASGRAILAVLPADEMANYLRSIELVPLTERTITDVARLRGSLEEVRTKGYAVSLGERDPWAGALAVPILTGSQGVIGAVSICGPLPRFSMERVPEFVPLLKEAAEGIADALGSRARIVSVR